MCNIEKNCKNTEVDPAISGGLNPEQLAAVTETKNAVVAAGAGSGKTFVLARRFAFLVTERGIPVDRILTLTFTEKAAAEMYQRIYKTLRELADDAGARPETQQRAKEAVNGFFQAHIQTIDSYCSSIVRTVARFYGIRPDFSVDPDGVQEFALQNALPFLLEHRTNPAIAELLQSVSPEKLAEELFAKDLLKYSVISKPVDYVALLETQKEEVFKEWKKCSDTAVQSVCTILEEMKNLESGSKLYKAISDKVETKYGLQPLTAPDLAFESDKVPSFFQYISELKSVNLRSGSKKDPAAVIIKEEVASLRKWYESYSACGGFIVQYPYMKALMPLLVEFEEMVNKQKRARGMLTFADIAGTAVDALTRYPEIRRIEKNQFQAIMIDEFQDDNELQRDLLFLLAERLDRENSCVPPKEDLCPDKLFFVGDEKQSIYKFRGADVSVFNRLKNELASDADIHLSVNYRSHPALIAAFNVIFGGFSYCSEGESLERTAGQSSVFLRKEQLREDTEFPEYEAEYTYVKSHPYDKETGKKIEYDKSPRIHICLYNATTEKNAAVTASDADSPLNALETEAVFVAGKIKSLVDAGTPPGDIAILFKSYKHQYLYEKHLRAQNVPYASETVVGFFGDAPVNDLYFFLRLLVYPQDLAAYAAVLRSPFCRISPQGLAVCMMRQTDGTDPVPEPFAAGTETDLPQCDKSAFEKLRGMYARMRDFSEKAPVTEILSEIWYAEGYRFETLWNPSVALFSELYDFLFEIARRIDAVGGSLSAFVDKLNEFRQSGERLQDVDVPLERPGAVRFMSIHKSKGLEFPIVFICCSTEGKFRYISDGYLFVDKEYGATLNFPASNEIPDCKQNWFFRRAVKEEVKKQVAELRRLLYVAATRAEKELYITGAYKLSQAILDCCAGNPAVPTPDAPDFAMPDEKALLAILSVMWENKKDKDKDEDKEDDKQIAPQFCRPDGTLFSYLLPVIAFFADNPPSTEMPFSLESIPPCTRKSSMAQTGAYQSITDILAVVSPEYTNATVLQTEQIAGNRISPSSLHGADVISGAHDRPETETRYREIDLIVGEIPHEAFGYNDFGTVAHAYAEALLTGQQPVVPPRISAVLSDAQLAKVKHAAQEMAKGFANSELGKRAQNAAWCKSEYSFKMRLEKDLPVSGKTIPAGTIINGQIDLLFEDGEDLCIVDFKTDSIEDPQKYVLQLASYCKAASLMRQKKVRAWLFYLRSGHCLEITDKVMESAFFS